MKTFPGCILASRKPKPYALIKQSVYNKLLTNQCDLAECPTIFLLYKTLSCWYYLKTYSFSAAPGHHPVKKRNLTSVTKCQNCNGSGIIFVGGIKNKLNQNNAEKPFHCNICGGSFSRYSSLWSHKKLHSGEKNFKCGICGIAFAKAVYLKNHSRIHTGEKPYR